MNIKKFLLIPLTIAIGVLIGFNLPEEPIDEEPVEHTDVVYYQDTKIKELHTPKYLSKQTINYKDEYRKSRPTPTTQEEEIVAYFEDSHAKQYEKNPKAYEANGTVYINLDGKPQAIASHTNLNIAMMPKLSVSQLYISYTLCNETNGSCDLIVEYLPTHTKKVLKDAQNVFWHPYSDVLLYDNQKSDDDMSLTSSDIFLYDTPSKTTIQLTDTTDFIETNPIFSEDGETIYCDDAKTDRLVYLESRYSNASYVKSVLFYKSSDSSLDIEEIKKRSKLFRPILHDERFGDKDSDYWIELTLKTTMKSGFYQTYTHPFIFDKNSFTAQQLELNASQEKRLAYHGDKRLVYAFNYHAGVDAKRYYFRLKSYTLPTPFRQNLYRVETVEPQPYMDNRPPDPIFYSYEKQVLIYTILASMVIGMILMSALYTTVIYLYRRQKEFIYYTLMQMSMALFLFYPYSFFKGIFRVEFLSMPQLSLLVAFFATLFTQAFFKTKAYLPKLHTALNFYLVLILADMIWIFDPLLFRFRLYEVFALLFLIIAVIRGKNGFKPAWFYLIGWIGLLACLFAMDYFEAKDFMMYIGVFVEAIMLTWGLVYRRDVLGGR